MAQTLRRLRVREPGRDSGSPKTGLKRKTPGGRFSIRRRSSWREATGLFLVLAGPSAGLFDSYRLRRSRDGKMSKFLAAFHRGDEPLGLKATASPSLARIVGIAVFRGDLAAGAAAPSATAGAGQLR